MDSLHRVCIGLSGCMPMRYTPGKHEQSAPQSAKCVVRGAAAVDVPRSRQSMLLRFAHEFGAMLCRKHLCRSIVQHGMLLSRSARLTDAKSVRGSSVPGSRRASYAQPPHIRHANATHAMGFRWNWRIDMAGAIMPCRLSVDCPTNPDAATIPSTRIR